MKKYFALMGLLFWLLVAFSPQDNYPVIKGRLKRVDHYMSNAFTNYTYNKEGRIASIEKPYGHRVNYSYAGNLIFIETIDPRWSKPDYDTMILKSYGLVDSVIGERSFWNCQYDLNGSLTSETYTRTRGKARKPAAAEYFLSYEYYPPMTDANAPELLTGDGMPRIKKLVGLNAQGDTMQYFTYKYLFDSLGKVTTRMKYYRTGQLYDSLGFSYY